MINHSADELGCAYADEYLIIEQTNLSTYFIGLSYAKEEIICSSMAVYCLSITSVSKIYVKEILK